MFRVVVGEVLPVVETFRVLISYAMTSSRTVIINNTQYDLSVKAGVQRYHLDFAKIGSGSKHTMVVDYHDTYQEFRIVSEGTGMEIVVTSDDCCDYKRITISEANGKFKLHREPRTHHVPDEQTVAAPPPKKQCNGPSWKLWKLII